MLARELLPKNKETPLYNAVAGYGIRDINSKIEHSSTGALAWPVNCNGNRIRNL